LACSITTRLVSAAGGQLLVQALGLGAGAMLGDGQGGQVGEGAGDDEVRLGHRGAGGAEQIQRAEGQLPQPQRQGERRGEAGLEGGSGERRPPAGPGLQILVLNGLAGAEGVQARAFLGLQLEQLQQAHRFAGGGHQRQAARRRGQHHPGGGDAKEGNASVRDPGQHVDDVIVAGQGVGHLDQRPDHVGFPGHLHSPSRAPNGRSGAAGTGSGPCPQYPS
jgi:hypothetical protein